MSTAQDIMRAERDKTIAEIDNLPVSAQARADVLHLCGAIQTAVNDTLTALDRAIDPRVGPAALYLLGDEIQRLNKRFIEAGLTAPLN